MLAAFSTVLVGVSATYLYVYSTDLNPGPLVKPEAIGQSLMKDETQPPDRQPLTDVSPTGPGDQALDELDGDPRHSWPPQIENRIWGFFAHRQEADIVSINSVSCTQNKCVIEFVGLDPNPQYVDSISGLVDEMDRQGWGIGSAGLTTREIAPGARIFAINISNIPVDSSNWIKQAEEDMRQLDETGQAEPANQ